MARPAASQDTAGIVTVGEGADTTVPHFATTNAPYDVLGTSPNNVRGFGPSVEYSIEPPHSGRVSQTL